MQTQRIVVDVTNLTNARVLRDFPTLAPILTARADALRAMRAADMVDFMRLNGIAVHACHAADAEINARYEVLV